MKPPAQAEQPQGPEGAAQTRVFLLLRSTLGLLHLLLVASLWGQWTRILLITLVHVGVGVSDSLLARRPFQERSQGAKNLRMILNTVGTCLYGHLAAWMPPVWIFLPLNALWLDGAEDLRTRSRLYVFLAVVVAYALLDGCDPLTPLTVLALSLLIAALSGERVRPLRITLEQLTRRRDELQRTLSELERVHRRAREQERLSSLGVLAAGIAHEVNNPMSYVKSNLKALHTELLAHPELPPELAEYTTEVLPETLEGVDRVCAIVADLRRFARGDPEALIEYDLNEEIHTALRITHGRLKACCEVEVALTPLPRMLGHPRQISQVVVNLLLNASQSMTARRGKVSVATRLEGENEVVLTVRDDGQGMTPEVLAHLFQPFFTTRQTGEGMGMGLAVVHGIITAHGGRIQVESEPSRGSTFTVHLPRVPPLKLVSVKPRQPEEEPTRPS